MNEAQEILRSIYTLIEDFEKRYNERPRYIKVPLWVKNSLIEYSKMLLTNFNYKELEEKEEFIVFDLKVCETITIQTLNEMEVF